MKKKSWSVTTDEGTFSVELKGTKVSINGEKPVSINKFAKKTHFVDAEYTIPLGNRMATLFIQTLLPPVLAYNGRDCATGEPWEYQKIPTWGFVFLVLDILTMVWSGWLWALFALCLTAMVIRSKLNMGAKIILSILLIIAALAAGTLVALIFAPLYA